MSVVVFHPQIQHSHQTAWALYAGGLLKRANIGIHSFLAPHLIPVNLGIPFLWDGQNNITRRKQALSLLWHFERQGTIVMR